MQTHMVRRRTNGTIDIDGHRQEALMLRARGRTEAFKKLTRRPWRYAAAAALLAAYVAFLPRMPAPPTATAMSIAADVAVPAN